jgi:hypothetical protein
MGPGLTRIGSSVLEDRFKLGVAKEDMKEMLTQIPDDWDQYKKLEYLKVVKRSLLSGLVGHSRKELKIEIKKTRKSMVIDAAINILDGDLRGLSMKQNLETAFRARANWCEQGEKSNKYFLNLNKKYKKQKVIDSIKCEGVSYRGQNEVSEGITRFYKNLYKFK